MTFKTLTLASPKLIDQTIYRSVFVKISHYKNIRELFL